MSIGDGELNKSVLAIYGSRGTGKEVLEIVRDIDPQGERWSEVIFIDDTKPQCVIAGIDSYPFEQFAQRYPASVAKIVIAVGEPSDRELLFNKVMDAGYELETIVHPNAWVSPSARIGSGVFVKMQTIIYEEASIGNNSFIQANVVIGHGSRIGEHCLVASFCHVAGETQVGDRSFLGAQSGVRENLTVGDDSVLAMGAMLMNDMPSNSMAIGNPARMSKRKSKKVFS